jgi:hypothetical protein
MIVADKRMTLPAMEARTFEDVVEVISDALGAGDIETIKRMSFRLDQQYAFKDTRPFEMTPTERYVALTLADNAISAINRNPLPTPRACRAP